MDFAVIIILGILLIVGWFVLSNINTRPSDLSDPVKILEEVDVRIAYGQKKQAIKLLEQAYIRNPSNADIAAKLHELQQ